MSELTFRFYTLIQKQYQIRIFSLCQIFLVKCVFCVPTAKKSNRMVSQTTDSSNLEALGPIIQFKRKHVLEDEAEKNLRRISYLQATKEAPMEVEEK